MRHRIRTRSGKPRGFSLIETIVTMSIFFMIMFSVYIMIVHYGDATQTEQARMKVQQENRFLGTVFADELKDAGAVLTLAHTFLKETASFNGISPLNCTSFPDGIILAIGDPEAVTELTTTFTAGSSTVNLKEVTLKASAVDPVETPPWSTGDKGIVIGPTGYVVFLVEEANEGTKSLTVRTDPVYYSGQLDTANYVDTAGGPTHGNTVTYAIGSPVFRLTDFAIYIFK